MALRGINIANLANLWRSALALAMVLFFMSDVVLANNRKMVGLNFNVIDQCWRKNPGWRSNRQQLATCSVGFAGKMTNNFGRGLHEYVVTDPSDNPLNPKPGTLRYGATMIKGKKWITFQRNMNIRLEKPLHINNFTAIDGRGAEVHIAGNACLMISRASNIIIHGLHIHHCRPQAPSSVMGPDGKITPLGQVDGDAIRIVTASKVWLDHNTLYECEDGLLDVTRGSTDITISNNWFKNQNKVMLLGHDDGYQQDKNMKVTVMYNHFGPNCNQRMPRIRYGYAHVVNNVYQGWTQYAIGGSMNPTVKSQANLFIAPQSGNKEVTWRNGNQGTGSWNFVSVGDVLENGASFVQSKSGGAEPNYSREQAFQVLDAGSVRSVTRSAGAPQCTGRSGC